jgi:hypothetical protein
MKKMFKELLKDQKGQFPIIVLCFLLIGGLLMAPLLVHTRTELKAGEIREEKMALSYAADAGIEDALWMSKHIEVPLEPYDYETTYTYSLPQKINGKAVTASIKQIWPLTGLESDQNGTTLSSSLQIVAGISDLDAGEYMVQMSYDGSVEDLPIDRVGVRLPFGLEYIANSSSGITTNNPMVNYWRNGKVLIWDFEPAVNFADLPALDPEGGGFDPGTEYPAVRILTFNVTPAGVMADGSYSWVRTTNSNLYLAWDTYYNIYKISAEATDDVKNESLTLEAYTYSNKDDPMGSGVCTERGDYRATGNTMMEDTNFDKRRDLLLDESSATIFDIPDDAEVTLAYLYWSGWRDWAGEMVADKEVSFKVNEHQLYFNEQGEPLEGDQNIIASKWWLLENNSPNYSYSCFKDVTELVKLISPNGNATYTVLGVDGDTGAEWSYAGWSLIIIYADPSEQIHQFFLYDHFLYSEENSSHTFTIEGFFATEDAEAYLTCFVGEGDEFYTRDYLEFNDNYLFDGVNPQNNVWNGKSSGLDGELIDGVDIDTFNVSSPIINPGDTTAEVKLSTRIDSWNMVYIILAFRSEIGDLTPNSVGIISYDYSVGD